MPHFLDDAGISPPSVIDIQEALDYHGTRTDSYQKGQPPEHGLARRNPSAAMGSGGAAPRGWALRFKAPPQRSRSGQFEFAALKLWIPDWRRRALSRTSNLRLTRCASCATGATPAWPPARPRLPIESTHDLPGPNPLRTSARQNTPQRPAGPPTSLCGSRASHTQT